MDTFTRKAFLEKIIGTTVMSALAQGTLANPPFAIEPAPLNSPLDKFFKVNRPSFNPPSTDFTMHADAIVDLHCHPSLKMYLWNKKIWEQHHPKHGANAFAMQDDFQQLSSGYFKGLVVAHYLVEAAQQRWNLLGKLYGLIKAFVPKLTDKIEHEDFSNFTQINIMIDILESQIYQLNKRQKKIQFVIARDFTEFENALKMGAIPIAHAIEGAHALGRLYPLSPERVALRKAADKHRSEIATGENDSFRHIRNLLALKARGVCMMSLSHFFENDLVYPVEGISPDTKKLSV